MTCRFKETNMAPEILGETAYELDRVFVVVVACNAHQSADET
jgi:hypothetical protein